MHQPMVETEDTMHPDYMCNGEVRKHDIQSHIAKFLIVAGQVGV